MYFVQLKFKANEQAFELSTFDIEITDGGLCWRKVGACYSNRLRLVTALPSGCLCECGVIELVQARAGPWSAKDGCNMFTRPSQTPMQSSTSSRPAHQPTAP